MITSPGSTLPLTFDTLLTRGLPSKTGAAAESSEDLARAGGDDRLVDDRIGAGGRSGSTSTRNSISVRTPGPRLPRFRPPSSSGKGVIAGDGVVGHRDAIASRGVDDVAGVGIERIGERHIDRRGRATVEHADVVAQRVAGIDQPVAVEVDRQRALFGQDDRRHLEHRGAQVESGITGRRGERILSPGAGQQRAVLRARGGTGGVGGAEDPQAGLIPIRSRRSSTTDRRSERRSGPERRCRRSRHRPWWRFSL